MNSRKLSVNPEYNGIITDNDISFRWLILPSVINLHVKQKVNKLDLCRCERISLVNGMLFWLQLICFYNG